MVDFQTVEKPAFRSPNFIKISNSPVPYEQEYLDIGIHSNPDIDPPITENKIGTHRRIFHYLPIYSHHVYIHNDEKSLKKNEWWFVYDRAFSQPFQGRNGVKQDCVRASTV